eukprot:7417936-Ditylum_brightwellii.AAC.1
MAHSTVAINATIKLYGFSPPAIQHYTCLPLQSSRLLKNLEQEQTAPTVELPTSFAAYINQQPHHIKCLLGNLHADNVGPEYWIQAISDGIVIIAIDGSVAQKKGYFAVVFHTNNKSICFQGPCDGNDSLMTSYRTELIGILSAMYLLHALINFMTTTPSCVPQLFCDNISAVRQTNAPILPGFKAHVSSDFDLIQEIGSMKQNIPSFNTSWVKAHQDDNTALEDLLLDAQMN